MTARGLALLLALASGASAQAPDSTGVYDRFDQAPVPVGGLQAVMARVVYPPEVRAHRARGLAVVRFVVELDGTASGAEATRCPDASLCEAAIAAVEASRFQPARLGDAPVRGRLSLPIRFRAPSGPDSLDTPARLLTVPRVSYPEEARSRRMTGDVILRVTISADSTLRGVEVVGGFDIEDYSRRERKAVSELVEEAIRAVRASSFAPAIQNGKAVESEYVLPIRFCLR